MIRELPRGATRTNQVQNVPKGGSGGANGLGATSLASAPPLQQHVAPISALTLLTATVTTGQSGRTHVAPVQDTTVREMAMLFAKDAGRYGGKELRFSQSPGSQQPTLHVHKGAISGWGGGDERAQKKADAVEVVAKAIDREVGRPGAGKALLRQLEQDGSIKDASKLKARDLATIADVVDRLALGEQDGFRALEDNAPNVANIVRARAQLAANPPSKADRQGELDGFNAIPIPIDKDASFKALDGGAWGAMRVKGKDPDGNRIAFALKTEDPASHEKAAFVGGLFGHVEANAAEPLPLGFMKTQILVRGGQGESELTRATQGRMLKEIDGMIDRGEAVKDGLPGGSEGWKAVLDPKSDRYNGGLVSKTEWVGGSMLRDFSPRDKLGLIKSGALAEDLAHATVLGPMFGLSDHAGLKGAKDDTGNTNLSNFRMGDDGRLTTIDFDTRYDPLADANSIGKPAHLILAAYEGLVEHLRGLAEHPDPAAKIAEGVPDKGKIPKSPLSDITQEVLRPRAPAQEWSLFKQSDMQALGDSYTQADRVGFAAQLTLKSVDSLQYLSNELDTFEAAHQNNPKSTLNRDDFFSGLRQVLNGADLPALRARLGASLDQVRPPPFQG